jgi:hypothetical protein
MDFPKEVDATHGSPGKEFRRQALRAFVENLANHITGKIAVKGNPVFDVIYLTSYGIAFAKDSKVRRDGEQQFRWFRELKDGSLKHINWKQAKNRVYYVDNKEAVRAKQKAWKDNNPNYFKEYYRDEGRTRIDATVEFGEENEFGHEKALVVASHRIDSLKNRLKRIRDKTSPKGWKKADWTPKDRLVFFIKPHWALATDEHSWTVYRFENKKWRLKAAEPFKEALLGVIREMVPDAYPDALKEIQSWPTECTNWIKEQKEK